MLNAFATLEENIPRVIELMPSGGFDTHDFILKLAHENQRAYIGALCGSDSATPFQDVHSAIGKSLMRHSLESGSRIQQTDPNSSSPNIFGEVSSCSEWEKT